MAELSALVAMAIYISVLFVGLPALAWALVIKASQPENPIVRLPLAGLLLVILVGLLLVPRYKRTADSLHSQPLFARVWLYAVTVLFFAAGVFANITWELQQRGALQLCSEPQSDNGVGNGCTEPVTIDEIGNFYIYQLVNALPGNIPQNLDLSPPLYYEQRHVGILVILFTLVVTLPTINFMITAVRQGRRTSEAERLLKLGEHLDQRNDIEGAIRAYQGAADLGPAKVVSTATDKLGELRKRQKDNARAARAYQLALDS